MKDFFTRHAGSTDLGHAKLQTVFDAEIETPELINALSVDVPQIRSVIDALRESLPLMSHSAVGPLGRFQRLPNHYRSVSFVMPPLDSGDGDSSPGTIVFKGTEPLIADFPKYYSWMLDTPFRSSSLPLGLHFPLEMKLPPAAMWIGECIMEQAVSSEVQQRFLKRHQRLARLPLPLFVFKMTPQQIERYQSVIYPGISKDAIKKINSKLTDGLGVEVYFYPELPVRVADLSVGNLREAFKDALVPEQLELTVCDWARLFSELLCLGYAPYAPWHSGMGGCVDMGNACIDGGFNDLLTLVPFDSIPSDISFRRSVRASIEMLAESMAAIVAVSIGSPPMQRDQEATLLLVAYVTEYLRHHVKSEVGDGHQVDARLVRFCGVPQVKEIIRSISEFHDGRAKGTQFVSPR
jgi:hypothetical protein